MSNLESLEIAGVPIVLRPPTDSGSTAPLIMLWHGFGIPNSEEMLAEVLPLETVSAWKAYLGLPLFGKRLPAGGMEEIMRRQIDDYVLQLLLPAIEPAMQELPNVVHALQAKLEIRDRSGVGLFGFSAGGMGALLTLLESSLPIKAAALFGVTKDLTSAVDAYERTMQQYYPSLKEQFPWIEENQLSYHWSKAAIVARQRLDFVARASEMVQRHPVPAILFVHGVQDNVYPLSEVEKLHAALVTQYQELNQSACLSLHAFKHLGHQLDLEAAQSSFDIQKDLTNLQQVIATWFSQHLLRAL